MSRLLIFVEGDDDQRFVERIIIPLVAERYELIKIQKVAQFAPKEICKLLRTFEVQGWEYFFIVDKDQTPCITAKRTNVIKKWVAVQWTRIIVVDAEIESWYIAGVDALTALDIGFTLPRKPEHFSKEHLLRCLNRRFPTATDLRLRLLENYSIISARERSPSFAYLLRKLLAQPSN